MQNYCEETQKVHKTHHERDTKRVQKPKTTTKRCKMKEMQKWLQNHSKWREMHNNYRHEITRKRHKRTTKRCKMTTKNANKVQFIIAKHHGVIFDTHFYSISKCALLSLKRCPNPDCCVFAPSIISLSARTSSMSNTLSFTVVEFQETTQTVIAWRVLRGHLK